MDVDPCPSLGVRRPEGREIIPKNGVSLPILLHLPRYLLKMVWERRIWRGKKKKRNKRRQRRREVQRRKSYIQTLTPSGKLRNSTARIIAARLKSLPATRMLEGRSGPFGTSNRTDQPVANMAGSIPAFFFYFLLFPSLYHFHAWGGEKVRRQEDPDNHQTVRNTKVECIKVRVEKTTILG